VTRRCALTVLAGLLAWLFLADSTPADAAPAARPTAVEAQAAAAAPREALGCGGIFVVSSLCRQTFGTVNDVIHGQFVKAGGDVLGGNGATAERAYHGAACVSSPLDCLANAVADAAGAAFRWLWRNIDTATSIDLVPLFHPFASGGQSLMDVTIEVAALVGLALFFVQIALSALRAEPGGVGRAARGLVTAYVGSVVAILSIPLLDAAITQVCDGIVKTVTGKDLSGFGHTLAAAMSLSGLAGLGLPFALILVGFAIIVSAVIIWAAMMIRKMLVVVAAIFAPLAFSGATADMTKNWMRRWIEVTLALLFSKLILVIIMTVGFMMMDGYGQHGGITNTFTNVSIGVLLLALGGFAPLMALKMVHFAGEGVQHLHAQAAAARTHAQAIAATPQKVHGLATRMSSTSGNGSGRMRPDDGGTAGMRQPRTPLLTDPNGGGQARPPSGQAMNGRPAAPGTPIAGVDTARQAANTPQAAADRIKPPRAGDRPPKTS
jgi:type IV secretion system protein TrbL